MPPRRGKLLIEDCYDYFGLSGANQREDLAYRIQLWILSPKRHPRCVGSTQDRDNDANWVQDFVQEFLTFAEDPMHLQETYTAVEADRVVKSLLIARTKYLQLLRLAKPPVLLVEPITTCSARRASKSLVLLIEPHLGEALYSRRPGSKGWNS